MTLASLLSCSLLCRVLSVHFTSLDPHPASDLNHVDLYSGISVGPLFRSARHWFTSCWHNLCLSLSLSLVFRLTCCWPRAALWSWNLMRCLPFPSLFHSQEYFSVLSGLAEDGRIYRSLLQTLLNFSAKQTEICLQSFFYFLLTIAYRHFSTLRSLSPNSKRKFELLISSGPNQNTSPNSSIPIQ